jgi:hypothetical protein
VRETVEDLTQRGREVRDDVADAVGRGAHAVERMAATVKG